MPCPGRAGSLQPLHPTPDTACRVPTPLLGPSSAVRYRRGPCTPTRPTSTPSRPAFAPLLPPRRSSVPLRIVDERNEHLAVRRGVVQPPHVTYDSGAMVTVVAPRRRGLRRHVGPHRRRLAPCRGAGAGLGATDGGTPSARRRRLAAAGTRRRVRLAGRNRMDEHLPGRQARRCCTARPSVCMPTTASSTGKPASGTPRSTRC